MFSFIEILFVVDRSIVVTAQPFYKVENLDTKGFQFPRALFQCGDLMRDCNVGEVRIDDLYNLIIVVGEFLKLEIKIVQPGDELRLRRIASDDNELLPEDSFDDKPAAVLLRSGFAEQPVEAAVQLFIEPERVFVTRSFRLPGPGWFPVQYYNRLGQKKSIGADWSGLERTSEPRYFTQLYLAA